MMLSTLSQGALPQTERLVKERVAYWMEPRRKVPRLWVLVKRVTDVCGAVILLLVSLPVLIAVSLAIRVVSPGPVVFSQLRVGRNGRLFRLYKFRSMVDGAHLLHKHVAHLNEVDGPVLKISNDPRLHAIGAFLRRSSLDELPQLWNVLRGEMSLVGPRPPLASEVEHYEPRYYQRLTMTPGMTGLWQVSGRTRVPFRRWMAMDIWYVRYWSPIVDCWILLRTLPAVLRREGAW